MVFYLFFFNDTATTEIYTLSLHDALPISGKPLTGPTRRRRISSSRGCITGKISHNVACVYNKCDEKRGRRSEEHTSELQSRLHLVCRLLLEKKKFQATGRRIVRRDAH